MSEDVLVDTNVLLDVLNSDSEWGNWSEQRLGQFANRLVINPIIYTELCYTATDAEQVDTAVNILGLAFKEISKEGLFLTARAFRIYRERGGTRTARLADFFIGAHAQALKIPILTRDTERYRSCFPSVPIICP
jgi:predicted nucleic acid-binding protein